LGLANISTLLAIEVFGMRGGLEVSLLRSILGSMVLGTLLTPQFLLSISGCVSSAFIMGLLRDLLSHRVNLVTVSVAGGMTHNSCQLLVFYLFFGRSLSVFYIFPGLLIFGFVTGLFNGIIAEWVKTYLLKAEVL
jgi:heptaprenyl diphosphate synthase